MRNGVNYHVYWCTQQIEHRYSHNNQYFIAMFNTKADNFSVILFGDEVQIVKSESQKWDAFTIFSFLQNARFDRQFATLDADAIEVSLDILAASTVRGRD